MTPASKSAMISGDMFRNMRIALALIPATRAKMCERYGSRVPLDEPVISPGAQFDSPLLETVETR